MAMVLSLVIPLLQAWIVVGRSNHATSPTHRVVNIHFQGLNKTASEREEVGRVDSSSMSRLQKSPPVKNVC